MNIAIVGIQGLPNNYGGFETLSEYLIEYIRDDFKFTVYCSSVDLPTSLSFYKEAKLKYIPVSSHGAKGIIYDSLALIDAVKNQFDAILILGFGPGFIMPFFSKQARKKIILNFGGLDWKRNKWSKVAQRVIRSSEKLLVRYSNLIISDNLKIQEYIKETYNKNSKLIAYGGDQASFFPVSNELLKEYPFLNEKYAFIVTRIQPDNNIEMMLNAFMDINKYPLIVVGNWKDSNYGQKVKEKYSNVKSLVLLDAIYDKLILNTLRSNCYFYVHGHSAGGTNPSLCEAMYLGLPILAFASGYNEETTHYKACYFKNESELKSKILSLTEEQLQTMKRELKSIADKYYRWEIVASQYKEQFYKIINND